jgi:hypothetical protein
MLVIRDEAHCALKSCASWPPMLFVPRSDSSQP